MKKLVLLFLSILLSLPILFLYFLRVFPAWMPGTSANGFDHNSCNNLKCHGEELWPPFGVLGAYCGSPFLQINCSVTNTSTSNSNSSNTLGYWYPNSIPTDVLITDIGSYYTNIPMLSNAVFSNTVLSKVVFSSSIRGWQFGDFLAVPHPSMSTCEHIQTANFSSLFHNFRSFDQFNLQIHPNSSLVLFNCSSPLAISEDLYPPSFARGGILCTEFTRSCLQHKEGSVSNSSFNCFELSSIQVNNTNSTEALIAKLGCTSFACYGVDLSDQYGDNSDYYSWNIVQVEWKDLPNEVPCDFLNDTGVCGYFVNGSLMIHCNEGQNLTDGTSCPMSSPWRLGVFISGYSTGAILIVVCMVKIQSVMLWVTGEKYFKIEDLNEPPKKMSYRLLEWATQSFTNKIGEGSFGQVFCGVLPRVKTPLAVKVLGNARHSHRQFVAEVESIGNVHHVNLVRLIGFCSHKAKRLLVYEFIPNGSLDKHLFSNENEKDEAAMSWERRYNIIMGVARGLAYLHHECRHQVVHLDIKPANILLDHQFNAKIADFGLSKLMSIDQSKAATAIRGTPGYLAPELLKDSIVSTKCDVYSFGVLVIEVIAGRKWLEIDATSSQLYLPDWAFKKACQEDFLPVIDERVACPEIIEQARILILLSMWCIQQDPCLRPTMMKVVEFIEGKDDVPLNPPNPFESTLNIEPIILE